MPNNANIYVNSDRTNEKLPIAIRVFATESNKILILLLFLASLTNLINLNVLIVMSTPEVSEKMSSTIETKMMTTSIILNLSFKYFGQVNPINLSIYSIIIPIEK